MRCYLLKHTFWTRFLSSPIPNCFIPRKRNWTLAGGLLPVQTIPVAWSSGVASHPPTPLSKQIHQKIIPYLWDCSRNFTITLWIWYQLSRSWQNQMHHAMYLSSELFHLPFLDCLLLGKLLTCHVFLRFNHTKGEVMHLQKDWWTQSQRSMLSHCIVKDASKMKSHSFEHYLLPWLAWWFHLSLSTIWRSRSSCSALFVTYPSPW